MKRETYVSHSLTFYKKRSDRKKMSNIHKIIICPEDIPRLKKHGFLRVGKNLIVVDPIPIRQVKIFGDIQKL